VTYKITFPLREHLVFVETSHGLWRLNLRISVISEYCHTPKRREKGAEDVGAHGERVKEGRKDKGASHDPVLWGGEGDG